MEERKAVGEVFHVKDEHGNKLKDQRVINYIQQAIGTTKEIPNHAQTKDKTNANHVNLEYSSSYDRDQYPHSNEHTAIELTATDRPGLFSEISALLADLQCNIVEAHAWSHNARLACVAYISDQSTDTPIDDPNRLATIEGHLITLLQSTAPSTSTMSPSGTHISPKEVMKTGSGFFAIGEGSTMTHVERRLHQLMLSIRDFDGPYEPTHRPRMMSRRSNSLGIMEGGDEDYDEVVKNKTIIVLIENCDEKGYSIVSVKCKDRRRLMFDTVCTLTDMQYVIFHASIGSHRSYAFQEYFIRHIDGCALSTESEKERVTKCLKAAIERRVCEGVRVVVCADNRVGLLSDITRVLRENGLLVVRADVETRGEKAVNVFYVRDISGNTINMEFIESVKKEMGPIQLLVRNDVDTPTTIPSPTTTTPTPTTKTTTPPNSSPHRFSLGGMLKSQIDRFSNNFIPIK